LQMCSGSPGGESAAACRWSPGSVSPCRSHPPLPTRRSALHLLSEPIPLRVPHHTLSLVGSLLVFSLIVFLLSEVCGVQTITLSLSRSLLHSRGRLSSRWKTGGEEEKEGGGGGGKESVRERGRGGDMAMGGCGERDLSLSLSSSWPSLGPRNRSVWFIYR